MVGVTSAGTYVVFAVSCLANGAVLAYRWDRIPSMRRWVDQLRQRLTGRSDWQWLRLEHLFLPLVAVAVANLAYAVPATHCSDDALALLASGQAALHGQDPFLVTYCGGSAPDAIPYGLAAVGLDGLGSLASVAGIWIVWELLALAVVPLVWAVAGTDRRYASVLAACSVLYLPNLATTIAVENAIVPVASLLMLFALGASRVHGRLLQGLSAFLSTARFPAVFPLLAASSSVRERRWTSVALVLGVFLGAAAIADALWGWTSVRIVYLNEATRPAVSSLNAFALLARQGWVRPSFAVAVVQAVALLALVLVAQLRRYSAAGASAIALVGVLSLSQYLTYHFDVWLVPLVLLGGTVNRWLFVYGTIAYLDDNLTIGYLGMDRGIWWPNEVLGVVLAAVLLYLLVVLLRSEEGRRRAALGRG